MNYYEKLVDRINRSMEKDPRSAMIMDMGTFHIIAKGRNMASLNKKMSGKMPSNSLIFQKPSEKVSWIL
jgi:hypothetical protein